MIYYGAQSPKSQLCCAETSSPTYLRNGGDDDDYDSRDRIISVPHAVRMLGRPMVRRALSFHRERCCDDAGRLYWVEWELTDILGLIAVGSEVSP
jgi:hypothetical protein